MIAGFSTLMLVALTMLTKTPASIGPSGVVFWFLLLESGLALCIYPLFSILSNKSATEKITLSIILPLVLVVVLALSSLRQLNLNDILVLTILVAIIGFYLRRRK